ncbi:MULTISPECIES: MarR family transcriptional regulator [unclassified Bradyrhizobium]|uniref:MarR family transcriptional regulator n=1 Tax=unclassified Bradyrhizobium TaxID=2631580 RepID=UPI002011BACF|nr:MULTISPECIES: MarR family transcriptional regulator [unclassified Bradyrhizobium]
MEAKIAGETLLASGWPCTLATSRLGAALEKDELERLAGRKLRLSFEEIVSHPGLPEARRAYVAAFCDLYEGDPFLVRLLLQAGRFLVFLSAAVLEAAQDPARRETWFTVSALKRQLNMHGQVSDRQVDHLLARLCEVGFIEQSRAPSDRRVRLLATTDKLRSHHAEWLATHFVPLAKLYPDHDYGPVLSRDQAFNVTHCRVGLAFFPVSVRLMMTLPDTMLFFSHAAGPLIQNAVLRAAMDAGDPTAAIPYMDVADRFGVSRTHIRNLMNAAQAAGLVRIMGRGGRSIEITPRHWVSYDHGLAVGMYLHDAVNLVAMRNWTEARRSSADQLLIAD